MKKKIPLFKTVAEEQKFWQKHDSTDYIDWSKAKRAQLLKPKTLYKTNISAPLRETIKCN